MISIMNEWKIETPVACAKSILSLTQVIAWLSESLVQGLSLTLDTVVLERNAFSYLALCSLHLR